MGRLFLWLVLVLVMVGVGMWVMGREKNTGVKEDTEVEVFQDGEQAVSVVASGLEVPWAVAFLPDGGLLVTERPGRVKKIEAEGGVTTLQAEKLAEVRAVGEGGLLGMALHPDFVNNSFVYLYYTYAVNGDDLANRVVRFRLEGENLVEPVMLVDKIPGSVNHNGGRLKFGPDGGLYITTGDAQNPSLAQDINSLAGKILRVDGEGKVDVYSYGHRNPQGLAWDGEGRLWETEHGSSATDELNLIEEGGNYGWPVIRGEQTGVGMKVPVVQSGSVTWAPAGLAWWQGALFFGGLRGTKLMEVMVGEEGTQSREHLVGQFGRIRDVTVGPDGALYVTTSNRDGRGNPAADDDRIIKINSL